MRSPVVLAEKSSSHSLTVERLGLRGAESRRIATKLAICEVTNTSGVHPIHGTVLLAQTVCIIGGGLRLIAVIRSNLNRFQNKISLKDSLVNLQLKGY